MRALVFCCLLSAAVAYKLKYDLDNHERKEEGVPGQEVSGMYSFDAPNGDSYKFYYVADKYGYRVVETDVDADSISDADVRAIKEAVVVDAGVPENDGETGAAAQDGEDGDEGEGDNEGDKDNEGDGDEDDEGSRKRSSDGDEDENKKESEDDDEDEGVNKKRSDFGEDEKSDDEYVVLKSALANEPLSLKEAVVVEQGGQVAGEQVVVGQQEDGDEEDGDGDDNDEEDEDN